MDAIEKDNVNKLFLYSEHKIECAWWVCSTCNRRVYDKTLTSHTIISTGLHAIKREACDCGLDQLLKEIMEF